ncbi:hypothetical protein SAMN04487866_105126 [Thermoactinomyces sp. DSM 45891]|uniref:hypothetical protein n=1 Tax=Thermoactinomyces sp. DSM 45891 TaxID=1761907 RepID=UPI00091BF326|nr:hypothetical protein [Thermoactinomyces sp. DSM 45891]SFX35869.1 hypothetical protein SAMN04487866_105126 [Thermoactinomyces sp. DSM 45891]
MKKLIATGLALSMLMGGAVLSSSNAHASTVTEKVSVDNIKSASDSIETKALAGAFAKGLAKGIVHVIGSKLYGDGHKSINYDYDQVQEAFDQ